MVIEISYFLGIFGLIFIISGVLIKNRDRKLRDTLYVFGGLMLLAYSIYIQDLIFITLQAVFVLVSAYDLKNQIKLNSKEKKK